MPESTQPSSFLRDIVETVVFAFVVALLIRTFVFESFIVLGPSMQPELHDGERLFLNKAIYHLRAPRPGEVIVFQYPLNPSKDYIKRVIAVGGQRVAIRSGVIYINGQPVVENHPMVAQKSDYPETVIPPGTVFVLGDNRPNSEDSRSFGVVPLRNVKGKAFLLYWPPDQIKLIR